MYMCNTCVYSIYTIHDCVYGTCTIYVCMVHVQHMCVYMVHESACEPLNDKCMHNRNPYTQIKQLGFAKEVLLKFAIFLISYVQLHLVLLSFPFPCMLDIIHTVLKQRLQRLSLKKILRKLLYTCFISTGCMF